MRLIISLFFLSLISCGIDQAELPNENKGKMNPTMDLKLIKTKTFVLDSLTAPRPTYIQMRIDSLGARQLTFLNNYSNSIYLYDYDSLNLNGIIQFEESGPNDLESPKGYHIKSLDSIYIFSKMMQILLANEKGKVLKRLSLIGGRNPLQNPGLWAVSFPEYWIQTTIPFIDAKQELILTGQFTGDIPDTLVNKFKFMAHIDFKLDSVYFTHSYPKELYGNNYNYGGGPFTEVYPLIKPGNKTVVYSFPVSHHLYLSNLEGASHYKKVYGGSNFAGTITSLEKTTRRMGEGNVVSHFVRQDEYCAILYDKFRKVYYRFLRKAIPYASKGTHWNEMDIAVVIMDEDFKYLGEKVLGPGDVWYWQNSFVTEEGLNIEYIDESDIDEDNLTFKIFIPKAFN